MLLQPICNTWIVPCWINIINRIIGAVRIQIEPIAQVGVLLGKPGNDRIVEPGAEIILLCYRVKLLACVLEAVGDGLLLSRQVAPSVILVVVLDIASIINNVGGRPISSEAYMNQYVLF